MATYPAESTSLLSSSPYDDDDDELDSLLRLWQFITIFRPEL